MKGTFSLRKANYDPDIVVWGNLDEESGSVTTVTNIYSHSFDARVIAHDVIEHSVKHRTATYVPYEEEFRALGAMNFVRSLDPHVDLVHMLENIYRPIKNPPIIYPDMELTDYEILGDDKHLIEVVRNNLNYGYHNKSRQYNGNHYLACNHFDRLKYLLEEDLRKAEWDHPFMVGVSVGFDLNTGKLNVRNKWQPYR